MINICQDICPCNQCNVEQEDCELANAYIELQEIRKDIRSLKVPQTDN
jgi:hypothetical protein